MSALRTYPREWFRASRWTTEPEAKTFLRETERMLFYKHNGKERRDSKVDSYGRWYPTREEAEAAIAERVKREADAAALRRIRDAAPDLLEALQEAVEWDSHDAEGVEAVWLNKARAAISRALGEGEKA